MTTAAEERYRANAISETHETSDRKVRVLVAELLQGGREAILEHDGQDYRLRINRQRQTHPDEVRTHD
jgi:hemin uptake protein HemP